MDIIDIMMAKALSPQGQSSTNASQAIEAAERAEAAAQTAAEILEEIQLSGGSSGGANIEDIHNEIDKLAISMSSADKTNAIVNDLVVEYPDKSTKTVPSVGKFYKITGDNEDGTMTQKAITSALDNKASKTYVDEKITASGGIALNPEDAGSILIVGENGTLQAGDISESEVIEALVKSGTYVAKAAAGLEMDYENKTFKRTQEAANLMPGTDFNKFVMFGGRMRCNVADDGTINAFYGDDNYTEDGSNGQVMVYQPKFYYQRTPLKTTSGIVGESIQKDSLILSTKNQSGFKLHPLFKGDLDYVLLPAYEGCAYNDIDGYITQDTPLNDINNNKLSSIAGVKPISGANNALTVDVAEKLATNRGEGWHITNLEAESANQMLEIIEFGTMNLQAALESGVTAIGSASGYNCASNTGSTSILGNNSGAAENTTNITNGRTNIYYEPGYRAITYRGMENPWGNIWRMIGGLKVIGTGFEAGGIPHICTNFDYDNPDNYESIGFNVPNGNGWVSTIGYGEKKYDWVFIPNTLSNNANSAAPVGDNYWGSSDLNGTRIGVVGGVWNANENDGPFYYGFDRDPTIVRNTYSARLMFIPTKNEIYEANIVKWQNKMGE